MFKVAMVTEKLVLDADKNK